MSSSTSIVAVALAVAAACFAVAVQSQETDAATRLETSLEEIVVTAQKREQKLQDVGISVTALDGSDLRELQMFTSTDIVAQTPNLSFTYGAAGQNPNFAIRGVASAAAIFTNQPSPVAVHVDEVFLSSHAMASFGLFDLERVEVLRGPQGTLYGRNTTAGAVNFVSAKPSPDPTFRVSLDAGNYQQARAELVANGALSESINARLSLLYDSSDGYQKNLHLHRDTGGRDVAAYRVQLDGRLSDSASVLVNVHGGRDSSEPLQYRFSGGISAPGCADVPFGRTPDPAACPDDFGYTFDHPSPFAGEWDWDHRNDITQTGVTVTVNADLAMGQLVSITNYEDYDRGLWNEDEDASPMTNTNVSFQDETIRQFSQELRLSNQMDRAYWVMGAYYSQDRIRMNRSILEGFGFLDLFYANRIDGHSWALFGSLEYALAERWKLIAGLRYTRESKEFQLENSLHLATALGGALLDPWCDPDTCSSKDNWSDPSGKFAIEYKPGADLLTYLSYSRGFKSGGYPGGITTSPATFIAYDPEYVNAYELGLKSQFAGGRLRLNAAIFYYDYTDRQEFTFIPSSEPGSTDFNQVFSNAAKVAIRGGELELQWLPVANLDLGLGIGLLDTEYKDFVLPPGFDPADVIKEDLTGNELPSAPKSTVNGRGRYTWPLAAGGAVIASVDFQYVADQWLTGDNVNYLAGRAHDTWNARLAWRSAGGDWEVAGWVKNLANELYVANASLSPENSVTRTYGAPRMYGVNVAYTWRR